MRNYSKILSMAKEVKELAVTETEEITRLLQSGGWVAIGAYWSLGVLQLVFFRVQ